MYFSIVFGEKETMSSWKVSERIIEAEALILINWKRITKLLHLY